MSFTIVLTITCIISIVYRGVKKGFQPQDLSQQVHLLSCHIRCHPKTSIPSICCICKTQRQQFEYGSNSKWSYSFSDVLHIQCVVAFSIVVNMLSRPAVHRHHFDRTKIHPANWTHPIFQIDLNNLIECIMWNSKRIFPQNTCWDQATHGNCLMQR